MWVADMDFGVAPSITAALARLTRDQEYGYAARDGVLAAAFVRRMQRRFGWHTDPGGLASIELLRIVCRPSAQLMVCARSGEHSRPSKVSR
jgi:cystathionine beta-lyase